MARTSALASSSSFVNLPSSTASQFGTSIHRSPPLPHGLIRIIRGRRGATTCVGVSGVAAHAAMRSEDNEERPRKASATIATPNPSFVIREANFGDEEEVLEMSRLCTDVFYGDDDAGRFDGGGTKEDVEDGGSLAKAWKGFKRGMMQKAQMLDMTIPTGTKRSIFIARKVEKEEGGNNNNDNLYRHDNTEGEIIGYCEVVEERLDLRPGNNNSSINERRQNERERRRTARLRPVISNLSVRENARRCGVASDLVEACEEAVRSSWRLESPSSSSSSMTRMHNEVFAQVEDGNVAAKKFFGRRGYVEMFADPTCKKVVLDGSLFPREVTLTKVTMSKSIYLE